MMMDKTESKKIAQAFLDRKLKLRRFQTSFSGTWKTTAEDFFPMLCPAREADWIPGWTAEILYSEAEGLVSPNCLFRTDQTNTAWGPGLWYFIGYEKNKFVEVLRKNINTIMQMRIETKENVDGTVTGTWHITNSAITEAGNQEILEFEEKIKKESQGLPMIIGHYLETGEKVTQ
jgi:hypothetical protein